MIHTCTQRVVVLVRARRLTRVVRALLFVSCKIQQDVNLQFYVFCFSYSYVFRFLNGGMLESHDLLSPSAITCHHQQAHNNRLRDYRHLEWKQDDKKIRVSQ